APSAAKKKPAAAANPAPTPGKTTCAAPPTPLTTPASCPWPRGLSSRSERVASPAHLAYDSPLRLPGCYYIVAAPMGILDRFFGPPSEAKFAAELIAAYKEGDPAKHWKYDLTAHCLCVAGEGTDDHVVNLPNLYATYLGLSRQERREYIRHICS